MPLVMHDSSSVPRELQDRPLWTHTYQSPQKENVPDVSPRDLDHCATLIKETTVRRGFPAQVWS